MIRSAIVALATVLAGTAVQAAPGCAVPQPLSVPHPELPGADQPPRRMPITGYTLALIWMPQHCSAVVRGAEALQCGPGAGDGFVLHGLWPDGAAGSWPQWCSATAILPPKIIARHYCATPSAQLLQHEWAKHGTCIPGATPARYFAQAHRLYARLHWPDMAALARRPLTERDFAAAFAAANPGMASDGLRLNLTPAGWLQEVWLCLDRRLRTVTCAMSGQPGRAIRIR